MATYFYKFHKEKKISKTETRLAYVEVVNEKGKVIGTGTVSRYDDPEKMVDILVREYELSRYFNSKSFNKIHKSIHSKLA